MFTLAHLSDPHLAPLPKPKWHELIVKLANGASFTIRMCSRKSLPI
jgi:hypothetical protein